MPCLIRSSFYIFYFLFLANLMQAFPIDSISKKYLPEFETIKYQAMIDVVGKHLSGILIIKNMDTEGVRCVFMNEMGVTFFDLQLNSTNYMYHNIMSSLNKKAVKIALAKDLGMILLSGIYKSVLTEKKNEKEDILTLKLQRKGLVEYYIQHKHHTIPLILNKNNRNKKFVEINQFYSAINSMPDSIFVQHHQVNFQISLKQIHATE